MRLGGEPLDDAQEVARIEGLREIRLSVATVGFAPRIVRGGEDDQRHVAQTHTQLAGERRSIQTGHVDVEDDQ